MKTTIIITVVVFMQTLWSGFTMYVHAQCLHACCVLVLNPDPRGGLGSRLVVYMQCLHMIHVVEGVRVKAPQKQTKLHPVIKAHATRYAFALCTIAQVHTMVCLISNCSTV